MKRIILLILLSIEMAACCIDPKTLTVGIFGYTGESGKALTNEVLKQGLFKNVVLIGRRKVDYTEDLYKNAVQRVVDFEKLNEHEDAFKDLDVVYNCMGTTRGKVGAEGFRRVDYDYVLETAKLAKANGVKQFHLVSSMGANKNSMFLYPKTKGEIEEACGNLDFDRYAVYRPAMLMCDRQESRPMEAIARFLIKPIQYFAPTLATTPVETLAKAIIKNTINTDDVPKKEIIENEKIFQLAK